MNKPIKLKGKLIQATAYDGKDGWVRPSGLKQAEISLSPPDLSKLRVGDEVLVKCRIEMPLDKHYIDLTDLLGQYATFHNESIVAILPKELPNKQESNDGCYTKDEPKCECCCPDYPKDNFNMEGQYKCKCCGKPIRAKEWGKHLSDKEVKEKIKELKPNKKPIEKLDLERYVNTKYDAIFKEIQDKINECVERLNDSLA